jgi:hypothetical protein
MASVITPRKIRICFITAADWCSSDYALTEGTVNLIASLIAATLVVGWQIQARRPDQSYRHG